MNILHPEYFNTISEKCFLNANNNQNNNNQNNNDQNKNVTNHVPTQNTQLINSSSLKEDIVNSLFENK